VSAAVSGQLVPQHTADKPAEAVPSDLLTAPLTDKRKRQSRSKENTVTSSPRAKGTSEDVEDLASVLRRNAHPMGMEELFREARYDTDSPSDVERYYIAVRDSLGRTIRVAKPAAENATLEAIDRAD
jgi:hypothetical protein